MLKIRKAKEEDNKEIYKLLEEVDEQTSEMTFDDFWVGDMEGKIVGTAKLEEFDDFFFLSSLSVKSEFQGKGVAKAMMEHLLKGTKKDIYIYTVLPEFFKKFNFKAVSAPSKLPSKSNFECERCYPEKCVCMVRKVI